MNELSHVRILLYFCFYELGYISPIANYKDGVMFLHYTPNHNFESLIKYCWSNKIFDLLFNGNKLSQQILIYIPFIPFTHDFPFLIKFFKFIKR